MRNYKILSRAGLFFIVSLLVFNISCRKDLDFESSKGSTFRFSKDTVLLDTVFTQANSETFLLKVYNDQDKDVLISNLYLNQKEQSPFRINVDGRSGFEFNEIPLRGKDSLMIFVEIAVGNSNDFWAEDEIVFENQQQVKLMAAVEDAIYHYPQQGSEFSTIDTDTQWDNTKSHVIYGKLKVKENKTLKIMPGTKIYFHKNGSLELENNAELTTLGTKDSRIVFRSDRHTPRYDTLPKQWEEIKFLPGSKFNANYTVIKGANNGINLDHANANLHNVEIYNAGASGIFSNGGSIYGTNVVISDAGNASLNIENGGTYRFVFSTFANMGATGVMGADGSNIPLYLSDYTQENGTQVTNNLQADFVNSIFYGRYDNGVVIDLKNASTATYNFESCLIKNEDKTSIDYTNHAGFNAIITENPLFISAIYSQQDLRLNEDSPARKQGNPMYLQDAPEDINGVTRSNAPNLGAYED